MKLTLPFFIILVFVSINLFAEEQVRISPERRESELLSDSSIDENKLRLNYIEAAEIKQMTGDLKGAAELFKKASLVVKGKKDFESLYKAAVLNIEMAAFRNAEADLRAILTFSDDAQLRIRSTVLTARLKKHQGSIEEAQEVIRSLFKTSDYIPAEALYFAADIFSNDELTELTSIAEKNSWSLDYSVIKPLITPEILFSNFENISDKSDVSNDDSPNIETVAAAIQLGSFSKRDNAEDLKKSVDSSGYTTEIRLKNVNGNDYFSVVVLLPSGKDLQALIIELKEKGYEGYPVY
ncbi:MAG: SPOR domain-containing protein [Spirochaetales bacterium]|uniref:SPOR domain-containing protein n=1 Tax=Candidatus Thalassospirochaeta sargassi TaxID=3119039 RepID=A0AAJ1MKW0_9SPIO|nr:SPOR domain-containing protein [Spirochaetales bacterium]